MIRAMPAKAASAAFAGVVNPPTTQPSPRLRKSESDAVVGAVAGGHPPSPPALPRRLLARPGHLPPPHRVSHGAS
jgi:hypothetical protein